MSTEPTRYLAAAKACWSGSRARAGAVSEVARLCADAIAAGGLVHLFGTGHSRIPVEEMFPRYGSYPGLPPDRGALDDLPHAGRRRERAAPGDVHRAGRGLAEAILANFELGPPDVMIVFSAGGRTAVPIEIAKGAKARGLTVVAVTSVAQADVEEGPRLRDHADVVLDLCTPVGDALVELDGVETPVGPGSTIAAVALVNEIKVQTAALLLERGALPPVLTSPALVGAEESKRLFDAAYAEHARRAGAALRGSGGVAGGEPAG